VLDVTSLVVRRGSFALQNLSVSVPAGGSFALLGPSGSGKTLFLETMLGLRRPDEGAVLVDGRSVHAVAPEERSVAYLPQDLALFPHLSVAENIAFCLRLRGVADDVVRQRVHELAGQLGIGHLLDRSSTGHLSGGEQQRVALARALVGTPRLLFLDEPFCALDEARRRDLHRQVRALQRELGLTMVFVTHDMDEARVMADTVALMRAGAIEQQGPPHEVFTRPLSSWAAHFLLFENVFRATLTADGRCALGPSSLPTAPSDDLPAPSERWFACRAEALSLDRGDGTATTFEAVAGEAHDFGAKTVLPLRLPSSTEFLLALEPHAAPPPAGTTCVVHLHAEDLLVLEPTDLGGHPA